MPETCLTERAFGATPNAARGTRALPFLERAPDGHGFADAFHLRGEREWWPCASTLRESLEGKTRPAISGLVTT
jgi:hypothetical protein